MKHTSCLLLVLLISTISARYEAFAQRNRPATPAASSTAPGRPGASQPDTSHKNPRLIVLARNYGDSVVLRWAPNQAAHFLRNAQSGYWVQRIELSPQNPKGIRTRLSSMPVKPWTLDEAKGRIRPANKADQFVAMAMQMLYGKGYTRTFSPDAASIINLSQEQGNRFSVALLAADFSAKAADGLGLRWVDRSLRKRDAIYLYQVFSANPKPGPNDLRDTAAVAVAPPAVFRPAAPLVEAVENGDGAITLIWHRRSAQGGYSGFYVERSADGRPFQRITDTPFIQTQPDEETLKRDTVRFRSGRNWKMLMAYTDSVKVNYRRFQYRIVGVDAFGDLSPASEVVTGMGHDLTPPLPPRNLRTQVIDNRQVRILWNPNARNEPDMAGYMVGRSRSVNGPFVPVTRTTLPVNTLEFIDTRPDSYGNYYTVAAVDTAGNVSFAPAVIAVIADRAAPLPPLGLKAQVDTAGIVYLTWPLGQDDDIVSYKVYRSYERENDFYHQLTPVGVATTTYSDTLPSPMLNEVVFYKIVSIDRTGNHSALSQAIAVNVPDKVPPTVPVLKNVVVTATAVMLEGIPSSSPDVVEYKFYRREGDGPWLLLRRLPRQATRSMILRDTTLLSGHTYSYALTAVDDARLESARSFAVPVQFVASTTTPVRNVQARYDAVRKAVLVSWDFPPTRELFHFVVYRSVNGEGLTMFKAVDSRQRNFQDTTLMPASRYTYAVRVQYHNQGVSILSATAQVSN